MSTGTLERTVRQTSQGSGKVAHIVGPQGSKSGAALVVEAYVTGMEIEALCGLRWVPTRDPDPLPRCQGCLDKLQALHG
jgi:hypothetical protein